MSFKQAPGATYQTVQIDEIILTTGVAMVTVPGFPGNRQQIRLMPSRTGLLPRVGEMWLVDREFGYWSFAALASTRPEMFAPATAYHYRAHSPSQTIQPSTPTAVSFTTVELDVGSGRQSSTVYKAPVSGWYDVRGGINLPIASADGTGRLLQIMHNGGAYGIGASGSFALQVSDAVWCAEGDTISLQVTQSSPAPITATSSSVDIWWRTP